jgi:carboxypeptidase Q
VPGRHERLLESLTEETKILRTLTKAALPVTAALLIGTLAVAAAMAVRAADPPAGLPEYSRAAARLIEAARADRFAWNRIAELTDTFGHRLSGSPQLEAAIRWAAGEMKKDGLENVHLEPVSVPHWVRGRESALLVDPGPSELAMLGLGNSVGTPPEGLEAPVTVVESFEDLEARATEVKGRIVLFNVPYTSYRETVRYRGAGASRAARCGAVAVLLRSVGPTGLRTPHTGALRYEDDAPRIPAAALAAEDAERLKRLVDRGRRVVVRLQMEAHSLPDAPSANLVGEIVGSEKPQEIVVLGGHIDSWDVGTGAMDDAGGCVATWDVLRLIKKLGLRPRRTIRVVLFTNEENGVRGGRAYRDRHEGELREHVLALESDAGVFRPRGFGFTGNDQARGMVQEIATLLAGIDAQSVGPSGGGADIAPVVESAGVPSMSLDVDGSRYFTYHHTQADTVERLDPEEVSLCVASLAVMAYVVADMPVRLPR